MADETYKGQTLEKGVIATGSSMSVDLDTNGGTVSEPIDGGRRGSTADNLKLNNELDTEAQSTVEGVDPEALANELGLKEGNEAGTETPEGEEAPEGATEFTALPTYDPENAEVQAAYDERFYPDGNTFSTAAVSAEWDANKALSEDTYSYLEKTLGVDKATVDLAIEGRLAQNAKVEAKGTEVFGGAETQATLLAWAKDNYSPERKAAFNAAVDKGPDSEEFADAVALLQSHHAKATGGKASPETLRRGPPRRAASPAKSATGSSTSNPGGGSAAKPFEGQAEFLKVQKEAGNDPKKIADMRARLAVSTNLL